MNGFTPITGALEHGAVYVLAALLVVSTAGAAWYSGKYHTEQAARARESLELSNVKAKADTTREVFHDSLTRIVERLAVQTATPARADAVDRIVGQTRYALDSLRAVVRALSVRAISSGDVTTTKPSSGDTANTVRRASFDVRQEPYTAHADVELPARGRGSIDLSVRLDSIPLTVRPSCGAVDANGIRPALVTVSGPPWATIDVARVEQNADVCRSPALETAARIASARADRRLRLAIVAGYGLTARPTASLGLESRVFVGLALAKPLPLPRWLPFH